MRGGWLAAGVLVLVAGAAGLIRSEQSQATASSPPVSGPPVVVVNAYVHAPVPPSRNAAAYFTVYNRGATPDRLESVVTGAGATAQVHQDLPNGTMSAMSSVLVPAHGSLRLLTGQKHVMIENVYGTLAVGQTVNMTLQFENAGQIGVTAPVVPLTASGPSVPTTGGHS